MTDEEVDIRFHQLLRERNPRSPMMDERTAALCARFKMLLATAEWDTYEDEVRAMREREVATLLTSTKDQFDYRKGLIDGIDRTLNLPLTYLATLEDPDGQLRRLR